MSEIFTGGQAAQIAEMYAIKHLPTNKYIPITPDGYTHAEPVHPGDPSAPIRLFHSESAANMAITFYCKFNVEKHNVEDFAVVPINLIAGDHLNKRNQHI